MFGESAGRYIIEISADSDLPEDVHLIGKTLEDKVFRVVYKGENLMEIPIKDLKEAWQNTFEGF